MSTAVIQVTWRDYFQLTKPRVVALMLLTMMVGMHLATPGLMPWWRYLVALVGVALCAGSAAAINHTLDRHIDTQMARTHRRPIPQGKITPKNAIIFAVVLGLSGLLILLQWVNSTTAWLSLCTLLGYAVFYTVFLKRMTPQNIVIGGVAGAAPPLLGWTAVTGQIDAFPLLLMLIIFVWTAPHFWALAIYRLEDYRRADVPMLPVTHGVRFTKLSILMYSILLVPISILPYVVGMCSWLYGCAALYLGIHFCVWALRLWWRDDPRIAFKMFRFSIFYLGWLFIALLADHYFL